MNIGWLEEDRKVLSLDIKTEKRSVILRWNVFKPWQKWMKSLPRVRDLVVQTVRHLIKNIWALTSEALKGKVKSCLSLWTCFFLCFHSLGAILLTLLRDSCVHFLHFDSTLRYLDWTCFIVLFYLFYFYVVSVLYVCVKLDEKLCRAITEWLQQRHSQSNSMRNV